MRVVEAEKLEGGKKIRKDMTRKRLEEQLRSFEMGGMRLELDKK